MIFTILLGIREHARDQTRNNGIGEAFVMYEGEEKCI
jgi:hypothetical protein